LWELLSSREDRSIGNRGWKAAPTRKKSNFPGGSISRLRRIALHLGKRFAVQIPDCSEKYKTAVEKFGRCFVADFWQRC
jgi:hypothetical protein